MRLTDREHKCFHKALDTCLSKLENKKNRDKPHWKTLSSEILYAMLEVEVKELAIALISKDRKDIISELKDIINISMFLLVNTWSSE